MKRATLVLAAAFAAAALLPLQASAQVKPPKAGAPSSYTVGKGETLVMIAQKLRYPKATENQMIYAFVRENPNAFSPRTKERLLPGARLTVPNEATVLSYKPEVADREVELLRKSESRYQEAVAAENAGNMKGAIKAYIEAARLGHPLADLRLGQLYDKDASRTMPRDLQESISHYQKAREFGIDIKGPTDRAPQVTKTNR